MKLGEFALHPPKTWFYRR